MFKVPQEIKSAGTPWIGGINNDDVGQSLGNTPIRPSTSWSYRL
jgi:hypothetical protein